MKILVTNDDGANARGLYTLVQALKELGDIYVTAPDRQRSGTGHSITVFEPIRVMPLKLKDIKQGWIVGGTPVDCVKLAINRLLPEPVDLVISGINHGPNLGTDVLYSGTVSAAAEGVILGIPAIAVSLNSFSEEMDFGFAADFSKRIVQLVLEHGINPSTLLNVNVPALPTEEIKGVKVSKLGVRNYENLFEERLDPRGNTYYWMGGGIMQEEQDEDSDVYAVENGYISITPVHLDLTDYDLIHQFRASTERFLNRTFTVQPKQD